MHAYHRLPAAAAVNNDDDIEGRVWVRSAIALWILFAVVLCVRTLIEPDGKGVLPDYSSGVEAWWEDRLYKLRSGYVYPPTFSVAFTPFHLLPFGIGYCIWHIASIGLFVRSLRVLVRDVLPGRWPARGEGLFLGLSLVGSIRGVWSGQANTLVFALAALGAAAVVRGRFWSAAFLLAAPVFIKVWPLAFALLLIACLPRALAWRFSAASIVYAAIPFLTRPASVVMRQYESYAALLLARQEAEVKRGHDAWTILEQIHPVDATLFGVLQLTSALLVLAWCLWRWRRASGARGAVGSTLAMWVAWQLLLGPGTERLTYILIAPMVSWAVLASFEEQRHRTLAVAAWVTTVVLGTGDVERALRPVLPAAPAILPLGAVLFLVWVLLFHRGAEAR